MSKRGQNSPSKVRMMAMALVDESGLRWEFDTSLGYSNGRALSEFVERLGVKRVLLQRDRDVSDITANSTKRRELLKPEDGKRTSPSDEYNAGIYRRGRDEIAVISLLH
ncbi:hypothetical protein I6E68_11120 [Salinibacterium sp. NSLL150]|uniref:hypothetical protein n=1 Tax=unclassified Salinibacterium TaxID=2632331 RepID=UPI0018CDBB7E|nr:MULTISPECIES: hypothetical protein [unclassified Salinibacterium]MBH0099686.1 hypothetical protein [Salinibacterium sp. NSLL35]MBH0102440.1 hypothetical protein [Salinibacterium sp. NSLL150]MBH0105200.1 hypothetical protein [Salinibacterium sp. NSLL16]MBH0107960.1 hypothetical protein [Salinibacterium sp. NSLL17]